MAYLSPEVEADYHQFFLAASDADTSWAQSDDEMVATSPNAVVIRTGITTGPVAVALAQLRAEPTGHADQWETAGRAVVEVLRAKERCQTGVSAGAPGIVAGADCWHAVIVVPLIVLVALLVMSVTSFRLRDATVSNCTAAAWIGTVVGALALTLSSYRWNNQLGCREAFPRHFGYRGPNWEMAPYPVQDERSWWPLGFSCRGVSVYTREFVSIEPGWNLTVLVYGCFGCAVVAAFIAARRVSVVVRRRRSASQ